MNETEDNQMKPKTKWIILIISAIVSYPLPGIPSTILIVFGINELRKLRTKNDN